MPLPLEAKTILLVDDDSTVRDVVRNYLLASNYQVFEAADGQTALDTLQRHTIDLLILDLMLPIIDGLEVFRRLRAQGYTTPTIMLTAKTDEHDRILGLEMGADDYVSKPFSPRELVLRVQTVLRHQRQQETQPSLLCDGSLMVDVAARRATRDGKPLNLTLREFDLLCYFMSHPNQLFTRDELMTAVWGWEFGDPSTVTVHVRRLRSKIELDEAHPHHLITVWGRGYRWDRS